MRVSHTYAHVQTYQNGFYLAISTVRFLGGPIAHAKRQMILTNCAACAAPLARLAKQCSEEDLRRQGHTLDQGHYDSVTGYYRPGEDEEARTPRAAWSAAQTL